MRAWLLLLAVLATFQLIVQVASTEDNSISSLATTASIGTISTATTAFITAIKPIKKDIITVTTKIKRNSGENSPEITALTEITDFPQEFQTIEYKIQLQKQQQQVRRHHRHHHRRQQQQQRQQHPHHRNQQHKKHNKSEQKQSDKDQNKSVVQKNKNQKQIIEIQIKNIEKIDRNDLSEIQKEENSINKKEIEIEERKQSKTKQNKKEKVKMALKDYQIEQEEQQNNEIEEQNYNENQKLKISEDNTLDIEPASSLSTSPISFASSATHQQHHNSDIFSTSSSTASTSSPSSAPSSAATSASGITSSSSTASMDSSATAESSAPIQPQIKFESIIDDSSSNWEDFDEADDNDDDHSVLSIESQQPQLDAVIAEDGPQMFSNKEIIADKLKPDPSTLVQIENSLLSLFNMKRPPKIDRSKIVIPEAMKQLYAQIMGHELNSVNIPKPGLLTKSANTVRSFTHQDSKIDDRFPHHHRFRLHFDIKSIPAEEKLKAAELQLTRDIISHVSLNPRLANRTRYQVLVYDITRVGVVGKREPSYLLLDTKTIRLNSTDTVSLDVQPAVDRWLASPKRNFGLLVEVRTSGALKPAPHHHVRLRRSADEHHETWQHKQPLLFTYTDDGRHKKRSIRDVSSRSKRAGGHHKRPHRRKNNEEICRRHSLYVDFADVGWSDWIVAPPGYDAYYCHGKCPFPLAEHLNSTNHAVVQTLVNNINPGKVPKACCVPTQLEGISMLYLNDQSTVVLKNYQDMTVVGCGCR